MKINMHITTKHNKKETTIGTLTTKTTTTTTTKPRTATTTTFLGCDSIELNLVVYFLDIFTKEALQNMK